MCCYQPEEVGSRGGGGVGKGEEGGREGGETDSGGEARRERE